MKADPTTESEIKSLMKAFEEAVSKRDLAAVMALFSQDPDCVHVGTGRDEWCVGTGELRRQFERTFEQSESLSLRFDNLNVSSAGAVSWAAVNVTVSVRVAGRESTFAGRFTAVLEKRGGKWLFVQSHFSLPAAEQREGQSFPEAA